MLDFPYIRNNDLQIARYGSHEGMNILRSLTGGGGGGGFFLNTLYFPLNKCFHNLFKLSLCTKNNITQYYAYV